MASVLHYLRWLQCPSYWNGLNNRVPAVTPVFTSDLSVSVPTVAPVPAVSSVHNDFVAQLRRAVTAVQSDVWLVHGSQHYNYHSASKASSLGDFSGLSTSNGLQYLQWPSATQ